MPFSKTISFPIQHCSADDAAASKSMNRQTRSLDDLRLFRRRNSGNQKTKNTNKKWVATNTTNDNNGNQPSVLPNKVLSRVRTALFPKRSLSRSSSKQDIRKSRPDLASLQASLDSIEAFLQVVESNPEAKALLQKELARSLQRSSRPAAA